MRAQIASEYLFIMLFAFMLLLGYLYVVSDVQARAVDSALQSKAEAIAIEIQNEIITAARVRDGYRRTFVVDDVFRGETVHVSGGERIITVRIGKMVYSRTTPPYQGVPVAGENTIVRASGEVRFL